MVQPAPRPESAGAKVIPIKETSLYEAQRKIYARSVSGTFANWRWAMVWITQAIFYGLCWLPWNGRQAVLFDLVERKFYIFGLVFWPQDVFYLAVPWNYPRRASLPWVGGNATNISEKQGKRGESIALFLCRCMFFPGFARCGPQLIPSFERGNP